MDFAYFVDLHVATFDGKWLLVVDFEPSSAAKTQDLRPQIDKNNIILFESFANLQQLHDSFSIFWGEEQMMLWLPALFSFRDELFALVNSLLA